METLCNCLLAIIISVTSILIELRTIAFKMRTADPIQGFGHALSELLNKGWQKREISESFQKLSHLIRSVLSSVLNEVKCRKYSFIRRGWRGK